MGEHMEVERPFDVKKLTPARAMIAELVRLYWVLGMECSFLEIQKLAWFLDRAIESEHLENLLQLRFKAHNYGPYADNLRHLLDGLDGCYLKSDKRISDCTPLDVIWFNDAKREEVAIYLKTEAKTWLPALEKTARLIDGFESPYGMELLATVDWLLTQQQAEPNVASLQEGLRRWSAGERWAQRKLKLFDEAHLGLALERLQQSPL